MSIEKNERGFIKLPKYGRFPGGFIAFQRYLAGPIAIQVWEEDSHTGGELWTTATVYLHDAVAPAEQHVHLKGWSENEGLPEALQAAGILTLLGVKVPAGYCFAQLARLTDDAYAVFKVAEEDNFDEESDDEDDDDPGKQVTLTQRQVDFLLAASRLWQEQRASDLIDAGGELEAIATANGDELNADEIDALCEELNS